MNTQQIEGRVLLDITRFDAEVLKRLVNREHSRLCRFKLTEERDNAIVMLSNLKSQLSRLVPYAGMGGA